MHIDDMDDSELARALAACEGAATACLDWRTVGPIIEREGIELRHINAPGHALHGLWLAKITRPRATSTQVHWRRHDTHTVDKLDPGYFDATSPLVAAMRAYVAHKLGKQVAL